MIWQSLDGSHRKVTKRKSLKSDSTKVLLLVLYQINYSQLDDQKIIQLRMLQHTVLVKMRTLKIKFYLNRQKNIATYQYR